MEGAAVPVQPVSYTHLDVYKRQALYHTLSSYVRSGPVPYSSVKILNDIQFIRFSVKEKKEYIAPVSLSQPDVYKRQTQR